MGFHLLMNVFFFFFSNLVLPWASCSNDWNTKNCVNPYNRSTLHCWDQMSKGHNIVKMCSVNHMNVSAADLTDPVKEFWEFVNKFDFFF